MRFEQARRDHVRDFGLRAGYPAFTLVHEASARRQTESTRATIATIDAMTPVTNGHQRWLLFCRSALIY